MISVVEVAGEATPSPQTGLDRKRRVGPDPDQNGTLTSIPSYIISAFRGSLSHFVSGSLVIVLYGLWSRRARFVGCARLSYVKYHSLVSAKAM